MKQSDRASPYFGFHGTKCQSFALLWFCDAECQSFALSSCHRTKWLGTLVKGSSQAALRLATTRLPVEHCKNWTRHRPFDDTSSCRGRLIWTSQTACPLDKSLFEELTLQQVKGLAHRHAQHLQCNTRAWLHCKAEPSKFYLRQLTRVGKLPEREQSQLMLDQVLTQACKISPIYTQFQPITLQFCLTYIRCQGDGYESEHDWCMLSLGVSGLVCFVILVYQSRLSVDPAGRIYLRRSSQFLLFGFPWLISPYV